MIRLTILTSAGRARHAWDREEILVGRGESAHLQIEDPAAARNHCLLRREGDALVLIDLESVNGVKVRGRRVRQARLAAGDEFTIGGTRIRVEASRGGLVLDEPPPPPRPPRAAPVPTGAKPDFAREIRAMLRKTPWYTISLVVHILALLLLDLVAFHVERPVHHGALQAVLDRGGPEAVEEFEPYEPDLGELDPSPPEEEFLEPEERAAPEKREREIAPAEAPLDRPEIGTGRSLATRIKALTVSPVVKEGGDNIDKGDLAGEQERARQSVARGLGGALGRLRGLPGDAVVVIGGDFDKMEAILDLYDIPHTLVESNGLFVKRSYPRAKLLCINCARSPAESIKRKLVAKVKSFVLRGGWLITSDWAADPYLTQAFPQYVEVEPPKRNNRDTTVHVAPAVRTSPLLRGVFARREATRWWLEETSKFVTVRDRQRVEVLVTSEDMRARYGSDVVVLTFRPGGGGRILHLLGHFYQKDGTRTGLAAMQRLILNFLRERFLGE